MSRLWILPILGLIALSAFACSDEEALPSSTATVEVSSSPSLSVTADVSAVPTPSATVPLGWVTYTDPYGQFTVSHPAGWFETAREFSSVDPNMIEPGAESFDVEFSLHLDDGQGCGVLQYDLATGEVSPESGATEVQLGGVPAWKIVRGEGDDRPMNPLTRIEAISGVYNGYCFNIAGYFIQQNPDVNLFSQITSTFQFTF